MTRLQITLLIALAFVAVYARPSIRRSIKTSKIYGGLPAAIFHHIAVIAYLGVVPCVLVGAILMGPTAIFLGLGLVAITLVALLLHALLEYPARSQVKVEDRGWTKEDAESSGL
jgi:hypothetical protein